ncbi:hypothetical protein F4604DRAFT_1919927 [Suillus subluteus]|nr:hypothetical protein F4604DRAFT_1919927 [Suillus subluteus]
MVPTPLSFTLHVILDDVLAIPLIPALSTSFAFHGSPFLLIGLDNLLPGGYKAPDGRLVALSTSFAFHGSPFLLIGLDNLLPGGYKLFRHPLPSTALLSFSLAWTISCQEATRYVAVPTLSDASDASLLHPPRHPRRCAHYPAHSWSDSGRSFCFRAPDGRLVALSTSFAFHGSPFLLIGLDNLLPGGYKSKYPPSFNAHFNGRLMSSLMSLLRSSMILTWVLLVYAIITPTSC